MNRLALFFFVLLFIFSNQPTVFAAGTSATGDSSVYESIQNGEKKTSPPEKKLEDSQTPSIFPLFLKFILSFVVVIALLLFILRFLANKSRSMQTTGPVISLGSQMLGNNRSLQIVLIGQTIYLLGVGENVTLIRSISQGEEYQHLLESFENQGEPLTPKWMNLDSKINWKSVFQKQLKDIQKINGEE